MIDRAKVTFILSDMGYKYIIYYIKSMYLVAQISFFIPLLYLLKDINERSRLKFKYLNCFLNIQVPEDNLSPFEF